MTFVVQQGSPGFGYFVDVIQKLLIGREFVVRRYDKSKKPTEMVSDADVLILGTAVVNKEVLDAAQRLKLIQQHGRGVDNVDLNYATRKGVYVCNVLGENAVSVAEHAMLLILALAKKWKACEQSFRKRVLGLPPTQELRGKTLGIVGLGATGKELAQLAKAFGMKVLAITSHPASKTDEERAYVDSLRGTDELDSFLRVSDYLSIHVPLNEHTRGMVDHSWFDRMKPTSYLINVARGPIVDRDALYDALVHNRIAGAGLDVFWEYPPNPDDPLWQHENVVVTPHMAGFSLEVYERIGRIVAENILRVSKGQIPLNVVNTEVVRASKRG